MAKDGLRLVVISLLAGSLLLALLPSGSNPVVPMIPFALLYAVGQIMLLIGGALWLSHGRTCRRDARLVDAPKATARD